MPKPRKPRRPALLNTGHVGLLTSVLAVIVAAIGTYFAYRGLPDKREFHVVGQYTRIGSSHGGAPGHLRLAKRLSSSNPYSVTLRISNPKAFITADMYDDGQPLVIGLDTAILHVEERSSTSGGTQPRVVVGDDEETLEVGPGLFRKWQSMTLDVLVDGQPSIYVISPFVDVKVFARLRSRREVRQLIFVGSALAVLMLLATWLNVRYLATLF
jgi:hypothetical protein